MDKKRFQFGIGGMLLLVLLAACLFGVSRAIPASYLNGHELQHVRGMTVKDVRKVLGEPDFIRRSGSDKETWTYQAGFGIMGVEFIDGKA